MKAITSGESATTVSYSTMIELRTIRRVRTLQRSVVRFNPGWRCHAERSDESHHEVLHLRFRMPRQFRTTLRFAGVALLLFAIVI